MMSKLFVIMKLGRDNFYLGSSEILNMSWMGPRKLWMKKLQDVTIFLGWSQRLKGDASAMRQKYEIEAVAKGE